MEAWELRTSAKARDPRRVHPVRLQRRRERRGGEIADPNEALRRRSRARVIDEVSGRDDSNHSAARDQAFDVAKNFD